MPDDAPLELWKKKQSPFMRRYAIQKVGADHHTEWWVPAEELEELNDNLVGLIEVIGEYRGGKLGET